MGGKDVNPFLSTQRSSLGKKKVVKRKLAQNQDIKTDKNNSILNEEWMKVGNPSPNLLGHPLDPSLSP